MGGKDEATIESDTRDFCKETVELTYTLHEFLYNGTHDFTSGTSTINLELPTGAISFLNTGSYNIEYTCNTLVFWRGSEGEDWGYVYRKKEYEYGDDFFLDWYDNRDGPYH